MCLTDLFRDTPLHVSMTMPTLDFQNLLNFVHSPDGMRVWV